MSRTVKEFSAERNIDRIGAVLKRRASNAAGPMQSRNTRRARTRGDALRTELRIQGVNR